MGQQSKWQRIIPRVMVKYCGKRPERSQPTGMALLEMLVTIVEKDWMREARKMRVRAEGDQNSSCWWGVSTCVDGIGKEVRLILSLTNTRL